MKTTAIENIIERARLGRSLHAKDFTEAAEEIAAIKRQAATQGAKVNPEVKKPVVPETKPPSIDLPEGAYPMPKQKLPMDNTNKASQAAGTQEILKTASEEKKIVEALKEATASVDKPEPEV